MSTDNREQQLFPDVIEHYGTDQTPADDAPVSDGLDFPIRRRRSQRRTPPSSSMTSSRSTSSRTRSCRQTLNRSTRSRSSRPTSSRSTRPRRPLTPRRSSSPQSRPRRTASGPPNRRHPRHTRTALSSTSTNCYPSTPTPTRRTGCAPTFPASPRRHRTHAWRLQVRRRPTACPEARSGDGAARSRRSALRSDRTCGRCRDGDGGGGRSGGMTFMLVGAGVAALSVVTAGAVPRLHRRQR